MNEDITNVLNNFLLIPFRSSKYQYPCGYWHLTEQSFLKYIKYHNKDNIYSIYNKLFVFRKFIGELTCLFISQASKTQCLHQVHVEFYIPLWNAMAAL